MNSKKLILYGVGETADIAYEYFTYDSDYEVVAFTADKDFIKNDSINGLPVIPFENIENAFSAKKHSMFIAANYNQLNRIRAELFGKAKSKGYNLASYISSKAFVWRNVTVGENAFIFENNVVQHKVKIGNNVTLWSGNHIGHQTIIHDHAYLSSHCVVSGFCEIGSYSFFGVNCTLNDNIKIGRDNVIGSGALVTKNTEDGKLMVGAPARPASKSSFEAFQVEKKYL
jgi:sugar O-acyltransferase (sialic acid O-acetyltransferase NeuD family)